MPDSKQSSSDFASLYRRTIDPLRRYLARLLRNRSDAQDIAHDAYTRVYKTLDATEVKKPQALLFATARNLAINQIKRRENAPIRDTDSKIIELSLEQSPSIERVVMARQEWAATELAIERLPPGCRAVLMLCTLRGCTHRDAAALLGISRKTVEKQHSRALRLLRASLQATDESPVANEIQKGATGKL